MDTLTTTIEKIDLQHRFSIEEQYDEKTVHVKYNGYTVYLVLPGEHNEFKEAEVIITHENSKIGMQLCFRYTPNAVCLSIDRNGFLNKTKFRSYEEWKNIDNLELSLKKILGTLNNK